MKQAEHCGAALETAVEPHRAVEGAVLAHEQVLQIVAECLDVCLGGEVVLLAPPRRDRGDHAADQLLHRPLASGRADLPAEVFRDDDVGGLLRPGLRDLDVTLLEHDLTAFVADHGGAELPLHVIERVNARAAEIARERDAQFRRRFGWGDLDVDDPLTDRCGVLSRASLHVFLQTARAVIDPMRARERISSVDWRAQAFSPARDRRRAGRGRFLRSDRSARRSGTMRPPRWFVKRGYTTYCGFVLGQSQDVLKLADKVLG